MSKLPVNRETDRHRKFFDLNFKEVDDSLPKGVVLFHFRSPKHERDR